MNDQERLQSLIGTLNSLGGLDGHTYERLVSQLDLADKKFGYSADGRFNVAFFDAKSYEMKAFDARLQDRLKLHYIPASLTLETVGSAQNCKAVCIFVNDTCDASVIAALAGQGIELVALRCAGFNNVDLEACRQHGVSIVRVPAYSPYAVAEHSVALMMMLNRRLHQAYLRNRAGYFVLEGLTGFDMRGKTVGVVGTGKIGQCLIDILLGFGCHVLANDKFPNAELAAKSGVSYCDLDELLSRSDIVSLHVPLLKETNYLINDESIRRMKPGAMLINTSRGGLVDSKALIRGLKTGQIGAAGLDVYEEETGVFFHDRSSDILTDDVLARLMTFNNVVITSHQGFLTHEALDGIATTTIDNICEFETGRRAEDLTNCVT